MTARVTVSLDSDRLRVIATPNGRVRYSVLVYDKTAPTVAIAAADANLINEDDRAKILAQFTDEATRTEAGPLLMAVAADVTRQLVQRDHAASKADTAAPMKDEPWPEPVDGASLLADVQQAIEAYVVLPSHASVMLAAWVLHTYVTDVTDYTPYILVTSPVRECGKSVLLEVLLWLAHSAQMTGGYTAAALYRRVARNPSTTMLLDELDTRLRGDGGENIRGVLNTGYHRSGNFTICVGDEHEARDFPTFCPKVLAGIGTVWDTVAGRSIPVRMARASKDELRRLRRVRGDRIADELRPFRRQILRWADDTRADLRAADPETPEALGARQADIWRPLLAIADHAGGEWPEMARRAALALHNGGDEETDNALLLLADVRDILGDADAVFTKRLLEELPKKEDRPWSEYRHDKPISARGIASLLGRFGVKPQTVRIGLQTDKGYSRDKLAPAFNRYLAASTLPTPPELSVTSVTATRGDAPASQLVPDSPNSVTDSENAKGLPFNDVTDVTDRITEDGSEDRGEAWEPDVAANERIEGGIITRADGSTEFTAHGLAAFRAQKKARAVKIATEGAA